jgi:hypothetical protein
MEEADSMQLDGVSMDPTQSTPSPLKKSPADRMENIASLCENMDLPIFYIPEEESSLSLHFDRSNTYYPPDLEIDTLAPVDLHKTTPIVPLSRFFSEKRTSKTQSRWNSWGELVEDFPEQEIDYHASNSIKVECKCSLFLVAY